MPSSRDPERPSAVVREVPATFGRREVKPDPIWERDLAASLKEQHSLEELHSLYARHREGEGCFEYLMRRIFARTMFRKSGHGLQIGPGVVFKHPETMEFGDGVFIGGQAMIQGRHDGYCIIGNHVWIGPQSYFDARALELEDYVGWGPGAKVLGSEHTAEPMDVPIIQTPLVIKPVRVGHGADIGVNATVLPGVQIGVGAIVGAGSVVTHDVPDYSVVAGVPARVMRSRRDS